MHAPMLCITACKHVSIEKCMHQIIILHLLLTQLLLNLTNLGQHLLFAPPGTIGTHIVPVALKASPLPIPVRGFTACRASGCHRALNNIPLAPYETYGIGPGSLHLSHAVYGRISAVTPSSVSIMASFLVAGC